MAKPTKRPGGRPKKAEEDRLVPVSFKFPQPMLEAIEAVQEEEAEASGGMARVDRSLVVRELIRLGLEARAKRKR